MKKASEYHQHAAERRILAAGMGTGEHRDHLLEMASFAGARSKELERS